MVPGRMTAGAISVTGHVAEAEQVMVAGQKQMQRQSKYHPSQGNFPPGGRRWNQHQRTAGGKGSGQDRAARKGVQRVAGQQRGRQAVVRPVRPLVAEKPAMAVMHRHFLPGTGEIRGTSRAGFAQTRGVEPPGEIARVQSGTETANGDFRRSVPCWWSQHKAADRQSWPEAFS